MKKSARLVKGGGGGGAKRGGELNVLVDARYVYTRT